ncbi:hypothetical protein [Herbiconiux daphne]|uniref:TetR/AcrR family transcriptional regulator n=1 Tax=Herbiconiux daphne TaxID=2970914 RepID=A0ABT2H1B5_9MICO|nr:hypothetical protein [Herbiconiux daphne]MCS5733731.1 hypothetical protein [Herbiconiux daphne]
MDRQAVDRRAVLDEAVDVINRNGVLLGIRPSLLSTVAAKLHRSEREVSSLWPSSEAMRGDILLALAREGLYNRADDATLISTWNFLASHASDLATGDGRRDVLTRLIALVAQHNFEAVTTSMPWRNYVVCSVGAAESEALSETLTAELRRSENSFLTHMAHFYENVLGQIGFRLNDRLRHNHRAFAVSMAAVIEGLGIVRRSVPDILAATYGGADDADLSIASLLVTVLLDGLIEEDPHYDAEAAIRRLTEGLEFESVEP